MQCDAPKGDRQAWKPVRVDGKIRHERVPCDPESQWVCFYHKTHRLQRNMAEGHLQQLTGGRRFLAANKDGYTQRELGDEMFAAAKSEGRELQRMSRT